MIMGAMVLIGQSALADWTYTVRRGDSIYGVARRCGVTVNQIKSRNGFWSNHLRIGQRMVIPSGGRTFRTAPTRAYGDVNLLAHLIDGEAGSEPYIGKVAVGGVVMNRTQSSKFPKTIAGVVYQPSAFESVSNGVFNRQPRTESIRAARDAINGWDPSGGALYFFNPAKTSSPWIWARQIINRIGNHVFSI
jgi:N-acetylmuramoyl-L-alanine amidase